MVNRLTASGMQRAVAAGARNRASRLLEPVHAEEAQVHQGRHAQAHVVQPDQDPHRVVGEQVDEDLEAPGAERLGAQRRVLEDRQHGADRAVLVVPGRLPIGGGRS